MNNESQILSIIEKTIINVPNFPKEGVNFKDVTPILSNKTSFQVVTELMCEPYVDLDKRHLIIAGIESRGFIFGAAMAHSLGCGFVPIRKSGKLPRKTIKAAYDLEYGSDIIEMHTDAVSNTDNVVLCDDLIATGGSLKAAEHLIKYAGANVVGVSVLIALLQLFRDKNSIDAPVYSLFKY